MVPNKEEPESDSELTEEEATQPEQPEEFLKNLKEMEEKRND